MDSAPTQNEGETGGRAYHHGDLRRVIVETATAMLRQGAGTNFTMREVARQAGVSHAAPYKHFPDKAALVLELALLGFDRLSAALVAATSDETGTARTKLLGAAEAYLTFAISDAAWYRLMFGPDAGPADDVHLDQRALAAFAILVGILEKGQAAGEFRPHDLQGQAATCWSLLHGIAMLQIDGLLLPDKVGADVAATAVETLLCGLART